jgi:hypothetical protein
VSSAYNERLSLRFYRDNRLYDATIIRNKPFKHIVPFFVVFENEKTLNTSSYRKQLTANWHR